MRRAALADGGDVLATGGAAQAGPARGESQMVVRLALRTLLAHPLRTVVLAAGFGLGVAVMAILLGVGRVVLEQARAPELVGGGDVVVTGVTGEVVAARAALAGVLKTPPLDAWTRVASPSSRATLYLIDENGATPISARGGIPSRERAIGDPEVLRQPWDDSTADVAWIEPSADDLLRSIDRFHPIPDVPARADSWAEWLYFNGRADGTKFYLTFLVGPRRASEPEGRRVAGVRLQLDRAGRTESFDATARVDDETVARAPELDVGPNRIRVADSRYRIALDLRDRSGRRATGEVTLEASVGRLLPPMEIVGAAGWRTGYVVPVMSGVLGGALEIDGERIALDGGTGYHDHNWGFWAGVSWQWGQVQHGDVSFVFGRIFPPRDAADPERMPGFVGAVGPEGPLGYATTVVISEMNDAAGRPRQVTVQGRGAAFELTLTLDVADIVVNRMPGGPLATGLDFLQLRGGYEVRGRIGDRPVAFSAPGAAETFRGTR